MTTDRTPPHNRIRPTPPRQAMALALSSLLLGGCWQDADGLRHGIPLTGMAATVQIDLPRTGQQAQIAATVYKDAVAQPLVGGDVLQARTDQSITTLQAAQNLSGHYTGTLTVDHPETPVDVAVNYDQSASAEQRWFANDDLLTDPGPGSLVGYAVENMQFPQEMYLASPTAGSLYRSTSDTVYVDWTLANASDQVRMTAAVDCKVGRIVFRYGLAYDLGIEGEDTQGHYELALSQIVMPNPVVVTIANIINYIALLITESILGDNTGTLVLAGELMNTLDGIERCDIDLTVFREQDNPLPETFSGGYAITSRSDTVRIQYVPD